MRPKAAKRGARVASDQLPLGWVLAPPTPDDLIRVLRAWRLWILGGLVSALLGAALYVLLPPPYRARATVNVDFHLELAWPQSTDREQFYYLERESRKLVEIAYSDSTLGTVARDVTGLTLQGLRSGGAWLSQPGNGGWHFFGIDRDPQRASTIASSWATAFSEAVRQHVLIGDSGLERYITADVTQSGTSVAERSVSLGLYMLVAAVGLLTVAAMAVLLIHPRP